MQAIWSGGRSGFQGMNEEGSQPVSPESADAECRRLREDLPIEFEFSTAAAGATGGL